MFANNKTIEKENNFINIIKGSGLAIIVTLVLLFVFSMLLAYTNVSEDNMQAVIIAVSGISVLMGSLTSGKKMKRQGLINGGAIGLIYIAVIYTISSIIQKDFSLNLVAMIMIAICILAGALGGIIGVNIRKK